MSQAGYERSEDQVQRDRAAAQVSDVLLTLEHTLATARKGLRIVSRDGVDPNAELALTELIRDVDRIRKRFTQDTYYASDPTAKCGACNSHDELRTPRFAWGRPSG